MGMVSYSRTLLDLCDIGGPRTKAWSWPVRKRWERAQLIVVPEVIWQFKGIGDQTMWPPGDCPLRGHGSEGGKLVVDQGIVQHVAIEKCCIWS